MYISPILAFHLGQFSTSMIFLMGVRVADRMETPNNWEMHLVGSPVAARSAEVGALRGGRGKSADAWLFGGVG